jgi:hypothetical protein
MLEYDESFRTIKKQTINSILSFSSVGMSNKISSVTGFRYILQGDMILKFSIAIEHSRVRRD